MMPDGWASTGLARRRILVLATVAPSGIIVIVPCPNSPAGCPHTLDLMSVLEAGHPTSRTDMRSSRQARSAEVGRPARPATIPEPARAAPPSAYGRPVEALVQMHRRISCMTCTICGMQVIQSSARAGGLQAISTQAGVPIVGTAEAGVDREASNRQPRRKNDPPPVLWSDRFICI